MAKSEGNYFMLQDLVNKGENLSAVRYLLLSTYYRQQLNFTFDGLGAAKNAITRLRDFRDAIESGRGDGKNPEIEAIVKKAYEKFETALDDDLNISPALAAIFDFVRETNNAREKQGLSAADSKILSDALKRFDSVLGVIYAKEQALDSDIEEMIQQRQEARKRKDFAESDRIRDQLLAMGIILEDTPQGVRWKRKL